MVFGKMNFDYLGTAADNLQTLAQIRDFLFILKLETHLNS
jgi:hypothetical protein